MASSYHVDNVIVAFGMTALVLAITVDRLLNGLTRPFWGWVSDNIGRENAIFIAFVLEAIAVYALLQLINRPVWFVVLSGLCFFAWGNILDRNIGRENAIFIAFVLEAIAVYALLQLINRPVWFVVLSGLCFFAWGNI